MRRFLKLIIITAVLTGILSFPELKLILANPGDGPRLVGIRVDGRRNIEIRFDRALSGLSELGDLRIEALKLQGGELLPDGDMAIENFVLTPSARVVKVVLVEDLLDKQYRAHINPDLVPKQGAYKLTFRGKTFSVPNPHGIADIGAANCVLCHNSHTGISAGNLNKDTVEDVCLTCHQGQPGVIEVTVAPNPHISNISCSSCHDAHLASFRNGTFLLSSKRPVTGEVDGASRQFCYNCHRNLSWKANYNTDKIEGTDRVKNRHALLWSADKAVSCLHCHNIHLNNDLNTNDLCFNCHTGISRNYPNALPYNGRSAYEATIDGRVRHGGITCISCHQVHGSENSIMLYQSANATCLHCHANKTYRIKTWDPENQNWNTVNKPLTGCLSCHNPHGSNIDHSNGYLMNDDLSLRSGHSGLMTVVEGVYGREYGQRRTCLGCHRAADEDKEKLVEGLLMLPVSNSVYSEGQHLLIPAVEVDGEMQEVEPRSCFDCHTTGGTFH